MDSLNTIPVSGNFGDISSRLNDNFIKVRNELTTQANARKYELGYFDTLASLQDAHPTPSVGQKAYVYDVASSTSYYMATVVSGAWVVGTVEAPPISAPLNDYALHGYPDSPKTLKEVETELTDEVMTVAGYELRSNYNGTTSKTDLPALYLIDAVGDYFEIDAEVLSYTDFTALSIAGKGDGLNYNIFGIHQTNGWAVRGTDSLFKFFPSTVGLYTGRSVKRLEVTSSGWQLSVNGAVVSTIDKTAPLNINNIGNAYFIKYASMNVFSIKIHSSTSGDFSTINPVRDATSTDVTQDYTRKPDADNPYPEMLVELTPVTASYPGSTYTQTVGKVYQRLGNGKYACHYLTYRHLEYIDYAGSGGDFVGGKLVNHGGCKLATYNPITKQMTETSTQLILPLENEFVVNNSSKWSGGVHGNEVASEIYLTVNGKIHNPSGNMTFGVLPLMPCQSFYYTQKSELHVDSDKSLLAEKFKVNQFKDGGYSVSNKIKMKLATTLNVYGGLVCMSKYFTNLIPDFGGKITPVGDDGYPILGDTLVRKVKYTSSDVDADVSNTIIGSKDEAAVVRIWDRASDTKYYRQYLGWSASVDGVFDSTTTVTFR